MRRVGLSLAIASLVGSMSAADDQPAPRDAEATQSGIYRGRMELAAVLGLGSSHEIWAGIDHVNFLTLGARFGRVVCAPTGPGFLKGNLEAAGELLPIFRVNDRGRTTYGVSLTVLGRHYFMPSSQWRPYAVLGFGFFSVSVVSW